jgi:hypothetical protein
MPAISLRLNLKGRTQPLGTWTAWTGSPFKSCWNPPYRCCISNQTLCCRGWLFYPQIFVSRFQGRTWTWFSLPTLSYHLSCSWYSMLPMGRNVIWLTSTCIRLSYRHSLVQMIPQSGIQKQEIHLIQCMLKQIAPLSVRMLTLYWDWLDVPWMFLPKISESKTIPREYQWD